MIKKSPGRVGNLTCNLLQDSLQRQRGKSEMALAGIQGRTKATHPSSCRLHLNPFNMILMMALSSHLTHINDTIPSFFISLLLMLSCAAHRFLSLMFT